MKGLSELERRLLDEVQEDLPLTERPYLEVAKRLGITEDEVIDALKKLKALRVLRYVGPSFDSRRLGYVTTLAAVEVPMELAEEVAKKIAERPEVTHCYIRDHRLSVWFTVVAEGKERLGEVLSEIEREVGFEVKNFPAKRLFKLKATFELSGRGR